MCGEELVRFTVKLWRQCGIGWVVDVGLLCGGLLCRGRQRSWRSDGEVGVLFFVVDNIVLLIESDGLGGAVEKIKWTDWYSASDLLGFCGG